MAVMNPLDAGRFAAGAFLLRPSSEITKKRNCVLHSQGIWNGDEIMVNPIEIEGFRTPGHTIHDVTLRDCTLPQDASIRLALYDELTLQNIHSAAE